MSAARTPPASAGGTSTLQLPITWELTWGSSQVTAPRGQSRSYTKDFVCVRVVAVKLKYQRLKPVVSKTLHLGVCCSFEIEVPPAKAGGVLLNKSRPTLLKLATPGDSVESCNDGAYLDARVTIPHRLQPL